MYEIEEKINVKDMIYNIRGRDVILDSDLAKLYETSTKRINEVVKRNLNRFPKEFCFQINKEELNQLILKRISRSHFATLNKNGNNRGHNIKYLPYVFTEHGIMMLAGLLKSDVAAKVNVNIIKAFVEMGKFISEYPLLNIKYTNIFHDRFIISDKKELCHLGASLKDLGKKVFGINKINDNNYVNELISKIKTIGK